MNTDLTHLINLLCQITSQKEMKEFLFGILTEKELKEIPMRLQIVKFLKQNIPQQEIAKRLGVGIATVTRGSKELAKGRFKNI